MGLDAVFVDYLQLMDADKSAQNDNSRVSYISRQLKILSKSLDVPVIVCSQLSRAVEQRADKHPQLSDLRDSGSLEQDADVVMFIYRDEYYLKGESDYPNMAEVGVEKHRGGRTGMAPLFFQAECTRFANYQRQEINL